MATEWDEAKRAANIARHGIDFHAIEDFAWNVAVVSGDVRFGYGEVRLIAIGPMTGNSERLFTVVFTIERRAVRVISLRRASNREIDRYETES